MKSLELFSGAGGLAKGLELEGFEHVGFVEYNKDSCQTLRSNFDSNRVFEGDIRDFKFEDVGSVDVITGGPPCQPFSLGGKHKASKDHRDMFPYACKSISILKPKAFVFENVKGLLRSSFSDYFDYVLLRLAYPNSTDARYSTWQEHLNDLRKLEVCPHSSPGYKVQYKLINTANYGIPQTRERVIIVGVRADIPKEWAFPIGEYNLENLLWEQYVTEVYWEKHKIKSPLLYRHSEHFLKKIKSIQNKFGLIPPHGKPWTTMRDALDHLPSPECKHSIPDHKFHDGARSYPGHTGSMYDLPSKTIKAGSHGVPGGENMIRFFDDRIRYLTVHEAKLIQSFPENFEITGSWGEAMRQIGNAVPVEFARIIACQLKNLLESRKKLEKISEQKEAA